MKLLKYTPAVLAVLFLVACSPVENAVNSVQDVAEQAGNVVEVVGDAADAVGDVAGEAAGDVMEKTGDVMEKTGDVMEKAGDVMEKAGGDVMEKTGDVMEKTGDVMEKAGEDVMEKTGDVMEKADDVMEKVEATGYTDFSEGVLTNGETKVVFFHADWCPACRANEKKIMGWLDSGMSFDNTVYKANFDTESAAKAALGVTSQDSFVVVDGEGNVVVGPEVFPSEDRLKELLG